MDIKQLERDEDKALEDLIRATAKANEAGDKLAEVENKTREVAERMLAYDRVYWETEPEAAEHDKIHKKMRDARWALVDVMDDWEQAMIDMTFRTEEVDHFKKKLDKEEESRKDAI